MQKVNDIYVLEKFNKEHKLMIHVSCNVSNLTKLATKMQKVTFLNW